MRSATRQAPRTPAGGAGLIPAMESRLRPIRLSLRLFLRLRFPGARAESGDGRGGASPAAADRRSEARRWRFLKAPVTEVARDGILAVSRG